MMNTSLLTPDEHFQQTKRKYQDSETKRIKLNITTQHSDSNQR